MRNVFLTKPNRVSSDCFMMNKMASVAGQLAMTTFAGLVFSASGMLFHRLDKSGYVEEVKRHDKALENLSKAREAWYEQEVEKKDRMAQRRAELQTAKADLNTINHALDLLKKMDVVYKDEKTNKKYTFNREPQLRDFYSPSDKMRKYQKITSGILGLGSGMLLAFLL